MPSNTIQYAHAESKILIIQPPDWKQPKGYSAEIRVFLGPGTEFLPAIAETTPGGRAFIRCESLFNSGPTGGLPLSLEIGDIVDFALEGADVRVLAVRKGQSIVEPTASFTNMPINVLFAAHPVPPDQPAVGNAPIGFLTDTAFPAANFIPTQFTGYALGSSLSRADVWAICTNPAIDPLAAYAVAMAWGGQNRVNFRTSVVAATLTGLLRTLRTSRNSRGHDFGIASAAAAGITGLGIAFYTKLLYFFRPNPDAYILDQWTAKSAAILFTPQPIRLENKPTDGYYPPANDTTPEEYEAFCKAIDKLAIGLWRGIGQGEDAEAAMFDEGYGRGFWRNFVDGHFSHPEAGARLYKGWICCTTAQDIDDGWLVVQKDTKIQLFFTIPLRGSLHLRVLVARLRELGATDVFFSPDGSVPLPNWFRDACKVLNVSIHGGGNSNGGHGGSSGGAPINPQPNIPIDGRGDEGSDREEVAAPSRVQSADDGAVEVAPQSETLSTAHQPKSGNPPNDWLHLTWTDGRSFIKLHLPNDQKDNQGLISKNKKFLSLRYVFVDQFPKLKADFQGAYKSHPDDEHDFEYHPHGGAGYFGAVKFGSKAACIAFLVKHGFGIQDNTENPPAIHQ